MGRTKTYTLSALLAGLAFLMMAWSAQKPGDGWDAEAHAWAEQALSDTAGMFRQGPVDGYPDWAAASQAVYQGDASRGAELMVTYGCGACHTIPGVTGAKGSVGPDLSGIANRAYVGGVLTNDPGGLVRWLVDPPLHSPKTAMPDLGVTEAEARDMATYLFTLKVGP